MPIFATALLLASQSASALPVRIPVASLPISPAKSITHVEAMRSDFLPGQAQPEHMHPVPVVCFIAKGSFVVSIGDEPVHTVTTGQATIEPAGTITHFFRNASTTEPAALNCMFLAGPSDSQLTVMLKK